MNLFNKVLERGGAVEHILLALYKYITGKNTRDYFAKFKRLNILQGNILCRAIFLLDLNSTMSTCSSTLL